MIGLRIHSRVLFFDLMLRQIRLSILHALRASGAFSLVAESRWRRQRLLILCYHGTALEDEHLWRPGLYIRPDMLAKRLELIRRGRYEVLPLSVGLQRLHEGSLPPRSVAITFDDGTYDFTRAVCLREALPSLSTTGRTIFIGLLTRC
jgi:hypothetical protein